MTVLRGSTGTAEIASAPENDEPAQNNSEDSQDLAEASSEDDTTASDDITIVTATPTATEGSQLVQSDNNTVPTSTPMPTSTPIVLDVAIAATTTLSATVIPSTVIPSTAVPSDSGASTSTDVAPTDSQNQPVADQDAIDETEPTHTPVVLSVQLAEKTPTSSAGQTNAEQAPPLEQLDLAQVISNLNLKLLPDQAGDNDGTQVDATATVLSTPRPTNTPVPIESPVPTETPVATPTPTVKPTETPLPVPTDTSTSTSTPSPVPTSPPTATRTSTPTQTSTSTIISTVQSSPTPASGQSELAKQNGAADIPFVFTLLETATPTVAATATQTQTATKSPTSTSTETAIATPTKTPTSRATATSQPTSTPTPSSTFTPTSEPTQTATVMPTSEPTVAATPTLTPSPTVTDQVDDASRDNEDAEAAQAVETSAGDSDLVEAIQPLLQQFSLQILPTATMLPDPTRSAAEAVPSTTELELPEGVAGIISTVASAEKVWVTTEDAEFAVRLIGIDAPNRGEPGFEIAAEELRDKLENQEVILVAAGEDETLFGEQLRYVYLADGTLVNTSIVALGFAQPNENQPDASIAEQFTEAAANAARTGTGFWSSDLPTDERMPYAANLDESNVRTYSEPSADSASTGLLEPGETVTVRGTSADGKWLEVVTYSGQTSWVVTELLTMNVPLAVLDVTGN